MSQIFTKEAEGAILVDPTEPPDFQVKKELLPVVETGGLRLSGIIISGSYRSAIINDTLLKEGDSLGDNQVISIEPYHVRLKEKSGETIVLELFGKPIKEIPK